MEMPRSLNPAGSTHILEHFTFSSLLSNESLSGKSYGSPFPVSFPGIIFRGTGCQLGQEDCLSEEWQEGVCVCSQFPRTTASAFCTQRKFWFSRKYGIWGLHVGLLLSYVWDVLDCILLKSSSVMTTRVMITGHQGEGMAAHLSSFFSAMCTWQSSNWKTTYKRHQSIKLSPGPGSHSHEPVHSDLH